MPFPPSSTVSLFVFSIYFCWEIFITTEIEKPLTLPCIKLIVTINVHSSCKRRGMAKWGALSRNGGLPYYTEVFLENPHDAA